MTQGGSTRWCPTIEQIMILEEMYRGGIRNPNVSQIQQITAQLSSFGKIEGKNVFYWFQNHKARDKQKMRRRIFRQKQQQEQQQQQQQQHQHHYLLQYDYQQEQLHLDQRQPLPHPINIGTSAIILQQQDQHGFLHTECVEEATQAVNVVCELNSVMEMKETERSLKVCGHDWRLLMDEESSSCCRPLKTLELFPIESTGIKEESKNTNLLSSPISVD